MTTPRALHSWSRRSWDPELNVIVSYLHIFVLRCSQDFSDQVLTVEPTAECFCFHMFSTSFDSDKFGWFGGPVVSSFISVQGELSNM